MAKTKVGASSATSADAPLAAPPSEDPVARGESPEVDKLKALNQILLKETKELREKVSDLQSCLDKATSNYIERDVTSTVTASRLVEIKAAAEARVRVADADLVLARSQVETIAEEKDEAVKAFEAASWERDSAVKGFQAAILEWNAAQRDLDEAKRQAEVQEAAAQKETDRMLFDLKQREETIRSLIVDKAGMEETICSFKETLSNSDEKLQSITREKIEMEKHLKCAIRDREACKKDLDTATAELQMTAEKMNSSLAERDALKARTANMQQEFEEVKSKFSADMDDMMEKVRTILCKKEALEGLEKNKNDAQKELQKIKASLDKLVAENRSGVLDGDATIVMAAVRSCRVVQELEEKAPVVDQDLEQILSPSRSISYSEAGIKALAEGRKEGVEQEIVVSEEEPDKTVRDITGKLEVLETVLKRSVEMIKAKEKELQKVRGAMEASSKKSASWPWVYPTAVASTLAAIVWAFASKR